MASVTSLDKDLQRLRLEKYTPAAAYEARKWIEEILGEKLSSPDLLEGLKDGVALCRLINLAVPPPGVRFKKSAMPFVQMENISHFLRACQQPPLNLQQHDMFLTVDLYEQKDPAQVLQCLGAFSRAASSVNPAGFAMPIGPKVRPASILSPQSTGPPPPSPGRPPRNRNRGLSSSSSGSATLPATAGGLLSSKSLVPSRTGDSGNQSGRWSPTRSVTKSPGSPGVSVSSWSRKEHEGSTAPAWNIAQYGYMGGASQGNLGIAFGGRRQITSAGPHVPNLADQEKRRRREKEAEEERQRRLRMEGEGEDEDEDEDEEKKRRTDEETRWQEEARQRAEQERHKAQEERRRWEEEERQWKLTEERRRKEEEAAEVQIAQERRRARSPTNSNRLHGQYLSQYQAENAIVTTPQKEDDDYAGRVRELEKELELARQREADYERERAGRSGRTLTAKNDRARSRSRARPVSRQDSWRKNDEESLTTPRTSPALARSPPLPRPLPDPAQVSSPPAKVKVNHTGGSSRPLPDPAAYAVSQNAVSQNTASLPASVQTPTTILPTLPPRNANNSPFAVRPPPRHSLSPQPPAQQQHVQQQQQQQPDDPIQPPPPQPTYSREVDSTAERDAEDRRRVQDQAKTKAGGFTSKSLLEREMEMERQRQQEWEEAQRETASRVAQGGTDGTVDGIGGRWDVSQWSGFTGGDGMNKGSLGIGASRRPIVGPRPLPGAPGR